MSDRPTTEPRTEAGRRIVKEWLMLRPDYPANTARVRDMVLEAEAEAAQGAAPRPAWEGYDTAEKALAAFFDWANNIAPTTEADWHHWWAKSFLNDPPLVSEGAAPRAEGLDVERLIDALVAEEWNEEVSPPAAIHGYRGWAERILARLSRPSDERVPESEEA